MTKFKLENFNLRAGGGYVEYCMGGYLCGKRFAVGRFKYKSNTKANKMKLVKFLVENMFVEEFTDPTIDAFALAKARGWAL